MLYARTQRAFDLLVPKLLGRQEEKEVLGPLSMARAETVRQELVKRGIGPDRLSLAALGGTNPVVPFSDISNRWKDRRVEFILTM